MTEKALTRILNGITEDAYKIDERARRNDRESYTTYNVTINAASKSYKFPMDENSNWYIEDDTIWLETNDGTTWIAIDKIESIEI